MTIMINKATLSKEIENKVKQLNSDKVKSEGNTIFHAAKKWISSNYDIRRNIIAQEVEAKRKTENNWSQLMDDDLYIELNENNIRISHAKLFSLLKSSFINNHNPILNYFQKLEKWDTNHDYISEYASFLVLAPGQVEYDFLTQFKKWLVRTVKCAITDGYFNKQAFVLSDNGQGQNIGKTSWIRYLCPPELKSYYTENLTGNEKDDKIQLTNNFLINLDELAGLYKRELTKLKALMSMNTVNVRLPYARNNSLSNRIASFIGSTNETNFLYDQTGSVRWVCFVIKQIDFSYRNNFDINRLWAQAYQLSQDPTFDCDMTREEIQENERRNTSYYAMSREEEMILKYFSIPKDENNQHFDKLSATEILEHIVIYTASGMNFKCTNVKMGKYLSGLGFTATKVNGTKKYKVIKNKLP